MKSITLPLAASCLCAVCTAMAGTQPTHPAAATADTVVVDSTRGFKPVNDSTIVVGVNHTVTNAWGG